MMRSKKPRCLLCGARLRVNHEHWQPTKGMVRGYGKTPQIPPPPAVGFERMLSEAQPVSLPSDGQPSAAFMKAASPPAPEVTVARHCPVTGTDCYLFECLFHGCARRVAP